MTIMPAGIAIAPGKLRCDEISTPYPEDGKILVKTTLASICGSDLHIVYMGWNVHAFPLPYGYPGHEGLGQVVDGGGTGIKSGELVLTVPNIWASKCFAGYQLLEPQFVMKLPKDVPESHLLMAQQLGTVIYGCRKLPSLVGQTIAVLGQGSVGLFHDFILRRMGAARIIAIEPVGSRLTAARNMGVDDTVDVTGDKATAAVLELTGGEGADVVIEAVGSVDTLNQALHMARPLGRVAAFGLPSTMEKIPFDWDNFFRKRLDIHSVFGAQDEPGLHAFQVAANLISQGEIDMSPFVKHQFTIGQIQDAFDLAHSRENGALKVSLTFG